MSTWYFKDTKTEPDYLWSDVNNWWSNLDGTGSHPAAAPWTTDVAGNADNLSLATGATAPTIDCTIGNAEWTNQITGECDIAGLDNYGIINGGTFSGAGFGNHYYGTAGGIINGGTFSGAGFGNYYRIYGGTFSSDELDNYGIINGGTFSGDGFNNHVDINGGTFSGDGFANGDINNRSSYINGGTFSGDGFNNYSYINGGTFSGDGFTSNYSYINGGTFSGDGFTSNYSYINGGTFSGDGFNNHGYIYGGTFSGDDFNNNYYGEILGGATFSGMAVVSVLRNGMSVNGSYGTITFTNDKASVLDVLGTGLL